MSGEARDRLADSGADADPSAGTSAGTSAEEPLASSGPAGAAAPVACPACSAVVAPESVSCSTCGAALSTWRDAGVRRALSSETISGRFVSSASNADRSRRAGDDEDDGALDAFPKADPLLGVVVADRYRILEGLGRGGMGIVYKVEHTRIGKLLAMKLLTGELSQNAEVVRRFKQEALTASKLSCPSTVQVFDYGVADGLTYLVMELVAGEDLGRVLRRDGPIPFARFGKIVVQICASLAEAHQKGIVHRDIKPENVMLVRTRDGADLAKVLDFGLAKLREGSELSEATTQGAIVGTPYFMSPEQVRGEPVDARSDIYSLGAVMYRALTGHPPFSGPTPVAVFTKHLLEPPVPPEQRAPLLAIPPSASAIVMKALAKEPGDRYQRIEDLQTDVIRAIRELGLPSVSPPRLARAGGAADGAAGPDGSAGLGAREGGDADAIATRDEIEAYERKLRRQRYSAVAAAAFVAVGALAGGAKVALTPSTPEFVGIESEPNNRASDATVIPFGRTASGFLGKRIDPTTSDTDFYAVDVPAMGEGATVVRLEVTALPNFATCTLIFRSGFERALFQFCVGRAGRDLRVPQLRLEPGRHLLAIKQDLERYGAGPPPPVHENVSDAYAIAIAAAEPSPEREIEPNDRVASATVVAPGAAVRAALAWVRDEDVFCAPPDEVGRLRWQVTDVVRDAGSVLEVTPLGGAKEAAAVRVHVAGKGTVSATDVRSPWVHVLDGSERDAARCLRVRLANDTWAVDHPSAVPAGGPEAYTVALERVP